MIIKDDIITLRPNGPSSGAIFFQRMIKKFVVACFEIPNMSKPIKNVIRSSSRSRIKQLIVDQILTEKLNSINRQSIVSNNGLAEGQSTLMFKPILVSFFLIGRAFLTNTHINLSEDAWCAYGMLY